MRLILLALDVKYPRSALNPKIKLSQRVEKKLTRDESKGSERSAENCREEHRNRGKTDSLEAETISYLCVSTRVKRNSECQLFLCLVVIPFTRLLCHDGLLNIRVRLLAGGA